MKGCDSMSEKLTIEKACEEIEKIINKIENESLGLEESIELNEKACEYLEYCYGILNDCKGRMIDINEKLEAMKNDESDEV